MVLHYAIWKKKRKQEKKYFKKKSSCVKVNLTFMSMSLSTVTPTIKVNFCCIIHHTFHDFFYFLIYSHNYATVKRLIILNDLYVLTKFHLICYSNCISASMNK